MCFLGSRSLCHSWFTITKYRAKKFSDEALLEHVLKNPSATLEERAIFFSVKHQSVYTKMKALGITRKKKLSSEIEAEKENNIVYIDESGIKNTLRNEYAWSPRGKLVNDERKGHATEKSQVPPAKPVA
ncbi:hypothetical protein LDFHOB_07655 [Candidatus Electronema aureum]